MEKNREIKTEIKQGNKQEIDTELNRIINEK